jgi:kynureninase
VSGATGLIRSWNTTPDGRGDWIGLHRRVGDRIAPLVGAAAGDVYVGDSTSVSLFKTMVVALRLRPDRRVIVVEPSTFPTDGYVAQGVARLTGAELRWCDPADPLAAVDDDVASSHSRTSTSAQVRCTTCPASPPRRTKPAP